VASAAPFATINTIAHAAIGDFFGISIRALDGDTITADRDFVEQLNIIRGRLDLSGDTIVIGAPLAARLGLTIGDSLQIYGHSGNSTSFQISGLFNSRYPRFDTTLALMSIDSARAHINNAFPIHVGIKYHTLSNAREMRAVVRERSAAIIGAPPTLVDWQESNTAIFSALKLEKIFMIFTLGMIFIIVAINIYQALARKVAYYARELAVLKAVGGAPHHIEFSITYIGFYIGIVGGVLGVVGGLWLALNVNLIFTTMEMVVNASIRLLNALIIMGNPTLVNPFPYLSSSLFFVQEVEHSLTITECLAIFLFAVATSLIASSLAAQKSRELLPIAALHDR